MTYCDIQPSFYAYSEPVARKIHKCCECDAPIEKGEKHFHAVGKWEGRLQTFRQHLLCMETCMFIRDEFMDGECFGFGELLTEIWHGELRWQYDRKRDKNNADWKKLRSLMARILNRERQSK